MTADPLPELVVLRLSEAFARVWEEVAAEAGLRLVLVDELPALAGRSEAIALLAAGGEERAAERMLREADADGIAVIGADGDRRLAIDLVRAGAADYFVLPEEYERLRTWLREQADRLRLRRDRIAFADRERGKYRFEGILGESRALARALDQATRVIPYANVTVLITGETGTGKELLARAIHYNGPRRAAPFVDINCAAIPEQLLESELFGHEKGSFTGATTAKPGLFEEADGGTLFLDELGHLPLALQGKLLRALEERTIRRVGGTRSIHVDVRILAATHVNLAVAVRRGEFREDLYYRLKVVTIELPPLRARREDILPLARLFVERFNTEYGQRRSLGAGAQRALQQRDWAGNIRELRNVIERVVLLARSDQIQADDVGPEAELLPPSGPLPFPGPLSTIVRAAITEMLALCDGNKSEAARRLQISRTRLLRILEGREAGVPVGAHSE